MIKNAKEEDLKQIKERLFRHGDNIISFCSMVISFFTFIVVCFMFSPSLGVFAMMLLSFLLLLFVVFFITRRILL